MLILDLRMIGSEKNSDEFVTTADIRNRSGEYFYAAKDERAHETLTSSFWRLIISALTNGTLN